MTSSDDPKPIRPSHIDETGAARMVDVSAKGVTQRVATASAVVRMTTVVLDAIFGSGLPKGDALSTARIAGIQAAKRTAEWIPLCHVLPLDWVQIDFARSGQETLRIECTARATARTGVEMEALVGVSAAALTVYDMAKSLDKSVVIGPIQLEQKSGGKSGDYRRDQ